MSELDKFFRWHEYPHEMVMGTYLYPYRLFGEPEWDNSYSATKVITRAKVGTDEVLITCNGGLFLLLPAGIKDLRDKLAFEEKAANIFNRLICEFALSGIVSAPATPAHISTGALINNHALITSASGGREMYSERTIVPSIQLIQPEQMWKMNPLHSLDVVKTVAKQECTSLLAKVSNSLPTLVAGTYSHFSQRHISEALIDSWVVIEQIIDSLWKDYLKGIIDSSRKKRLKDERTYTAGIQIEVLYTAGILPEHLYTHMNAARKNRNDFVHDAVINLERSKECVNAMKQVIEFFCKKSVEPPLAFEGVNW